MPRNKEYIEREAVRLAVFNTNWRVSHDVDLAYDMIDGVPAADVVEVRYGRVIVHEGREDEYYEYCSECKTTDIHSGDNFCPNCGCKLVGVKHSKNKE